MTSLKWVDADPKAFEVPTTYTAVQLPNIGGSGSGRYRHNSCIVALG